MVAVDIVVAHDNELGIGKDNALLWQLPEDMRYFKTLTTQTSSTSKQSVVIMGRKTYESIPDKFRPLPNRLSIVVSRSAQYSEKQVYTATSCDQALDIAADLVAQKKAESIFCIGGGQLYASMIDHPACRQLFVTRVDKTFDADTFFPKYTHAFEKTHESPCFQSSTGLSYQFLIYQSKLFR
ncbi:dihydrofolate reductase [bacterium]|nr:dihydrofolate reductase [bacterium]